MGESQHNGAGHAHQHGGASRRRLAIAFATTATVLVAEVVGALVTGSLALLVDAAHMLTDSVGLLMALTAATLTLRPPTARRTWGLHRAEVLAAAGQAALLLAVGIYAVIEAVRRFMEPPEIPATGVLVFGVVGLLANLVAMGVLAGGRGGSINVRAAFLEVVNDALGSVAVIVSAIVIATTGWTRADAVAALLISALIVPRTLVLLRETTDVLLESAPSGLDLDDVRRHIVAVPHVLDVHDLHASQISTGLPVLSAHVVVEDECFVDGDLPALLELLQSCVAEHFPVSVAHSTFQLEPAAHRASETHVHR